jgi:lipopolysaccharide transport system permease protein
MGLSTGENASVLESAATTQHSSLEAEPPDQANPSSTDKPLITIERSKSWSIADSRDLWAYRELLYFLTWRDIKVRYKQTLLGVAWVIIQPVATMLIFTLLFGRLAGLDQRTGGVPYPIFAFTGLLPWTFFSAAVAASGNSLVNNTHLISKVYFPRVMIPAATVAAGLLDFGLSFAVYIGMMAYYGVGVTWRVLLLLPLVALVVVLALGVGLLLSAVNVKYRDIRHALPFTMQIWMFASPVIYPLGIVPARWRSLLALNPMAGVIEGFRAALLGSGDIPWTALATSATITIALLILSAYVFRRVERGFADII